MSLLITGPTGNIGSSLVHHLLSQGQGDKVVLAVRKPSTASLPLAWAGLSVRAFDFEDTACFAAALEGIERLFLLRPPQLTDVDGTIKPLLKAAGQAGVQQVVFLSIQGVDSNTWTPHYKIEQAVKGSELPFTFLRPGFFMQNFLQEMLPDIQARGELFVPAGARRFNFVDAEEVAAVAAKVLLEAGHEGKAYTLNSTVPIDFYRAASILSEVLGRPIRYARPSSLGFLIKKLMRGTPFIFAAVQVVLYWRDQMDLGERYTHTLQRLLGRPPKRLAEFFAENREQF